jgi:uncharacterized DUF497 family protein
MRQPSSRTIEPWTRWDRVLVVVYTLRGECIRIISARWATGRERAEYEQGL